jgi:hypothetical protein
LGSFLSKKAFQVVALALLKSLYEHKSSVSITKEHRSKAKQLFQTNKSKEFSGPASIYLYNIFEVCDYQQLQTYLSQIKRTAKVEKLIKELVPVPMSSNPEANPKARQVTSPTGKLY